MKTKLCIIIFLLAATLARAQTNNLTALLQQGLFEEQANRNLDAAIADYQSLARQFDKDRQLAATAVFRLGECYRMQGKTNEAALEYQRILRDFSDQTTLATLSQQNLTGMGMMKSEPTAIVSSDAALWNKLKDMAPAKLERILPTLVPDAMLDNLLQQRNAAQAQGATLLANGFTTNNALAVGNDRRLAELNRQIREEISGMMDGLKLRAELSPSPQTAGDARQQQKNLLAKQIALAEQDLAETQKLVQTGMAAPAESRAAEREVLRLKQQLAALDSGGAELLNISVPENSEEDQEIARIQGMIQNSPDLINSASDGSTPLVKAAYNGWLKVAAYLLDHGADVNVSCAQLPGPVDSSVRTGPITPLIAAVTVGNKAMTEYLISRGADINYNGRLGDTPLHTAAQKGFQAVVDALLAHHANVNAQNNIGATPLFSAVSGGRLPIVKALLAAGADVNHCTSASNSLLNYAIGTSPEMMQAFLNAGANPNTVDANGRTPLSYAVETQGNRQFGSGFGGRGTMQGGFGAAGGRRGPGAMPLNRPAETDSPEIVKMLLAAKADPNGGILNAPILCAVFYGNNESAQLLLAAGANPNIAGKTDFGPGVPTRGGMGLFNHRDHLTALWLAVSLNEPVMVQLLLKFKADPNDSQTDGQPLLFRALSDTNLLEALLDAGAKVDAMGIGASPNNVNLTPLGEAAWQNNAAAVETLLKHGASPNVHFPDRKWTALHCAAIVLADRKVFELLFAYKADRNVRDINGQTPLDILKQKARPDDLTTDTAGKNKAGELADLLRQHGALDNLPEWDRITVSRPSLKYSAVIFYKGTNDWNRFTLLDTILNCYQSSHSFGGGTITPAGMSQVMQFPDLARVTILRHTRGSTNETRIPVNLLNSTNGVECSKDVPLEFGDVVEIPERNHALGDHPVGLTDSEAKSITDYLKGSVLLVTHDQKVELSIYPSAAGSELGSVVRQEEAQKILLSSSDLSRVKVIRRDAKTGKTREWIVDCSPPQSPSNGSMVFSFQLTAGADSQPTSDLWLRDGDVIEVPQKP